MKRGCIIVIISISALFGGLFFWGYVLYRIYNGPRYLIIRNNGELKNSKLRLISNQRFNRIHGIGFYVVNFKLRDNHNKTFEIGNMVFRSPSWDKDIKVFEVEDWILLPVPDRIWATILMANFSHEIRVDTCFSPLELDLDTLWKSKYDDILDWKYENYSGKSVIDTIIENQFFITYYYRVEDQKSYKYYSQTLKYEMDLITGAIVTKKVFDRKEYYEDRFN